jgi:hypothetical protein
MCGKRVQFRDALLHNGTTSGEVLNVNVEYIDNFMADIECRTRKYGFSPVQLNGNLVGTKCRSGSSGEAKKKKHTTHGNRTPDIQATGGCTTDWSLPIFY